MALPVIGIIGLGFLGREIGLLENWPAPSWGTNLTQPQVSNHPSLPVNQFRFDWQNDTHWNRLPQEEGVLILTAPPIHPEVDHEVKRLKAWGNWMNNNRRGYQSLVYISTTGVYPNQNGNWTETDTVEPDSPKGQLRLATEKTLAEFFDLSVIRSGAIYGPGRNIGNRILTGKPVPSGDQPVHRIHVADLARIVRMVISEKELPAIINAVDNDPTPTRMAAEWLLQQSFPTIPPETTLLLKAGFATRKEMQSADRRFINNRLLRDRCEYRFSYPSYKEGLTAAFGQS